MCVRFFAAVVVIHSGAQLRLLPLMLVLVLLCCYCSCLLLVFSFVFFVYLKIFFPLFGFSAWQFHKRAFLFILLLLFALLLLTCSWILASERARKSKVLFYRMNEHTKNIHTHIAHTHNFFPFTSYKYQNFCHWIAKVSQYEMMYLHLYMFIQLMNTLCTLDTYMKSDIYEKKTNSRNRTHLMKNWKRSRASKMTTTYTFGVPVCVCVYWERNDNNKTRLENILVRCTRMRARSLALVVQIHGMSLENLFFLLFLFYFFFWSWWHSWFGFCCFLIPVMVTVANGDDDGNNVDNDCMV